MSGFSANAGTRREEEADRHNCGKALLDAAPVSPSIAAADPRRQATAVVVRASRLSISATASAIYEADDDEHDDDREADPLENAHTNERTLNPTRSRRPARREALEHAVVDDDGRGTAATRPLPQRLLHLQATAEARSSETPAIPQLMNAEGDLLR